MKNMIKIMTDYILEYHPHDSGIVYCLTRNVSCVHLSSSYYLNNGRRMPKPLPKSSMNRVKGRFGQEYTTQRRKIVKKKACMYSGGKATLKLSVPQ